MKRWERELPQLLDRTLKTTVLQLEKAKREGLTIKEVNTDNQFFEDLIKIQVIPNAVAEQGKGLIRADMVAGRNLWVESQRYLLTKTSNVLKKHKWSIVEPAKGSQWFTSDHPVIRLNYYSDGTYDLKGGWGNRGANLLMPLSPQHLLFTQIGFDAPDRFTFSSEKTLEIQKFSAERALRWIFAREPIRLVAQLRSRHIDASAVKAEEEQWKKWHKAQSSAYE
jgi:hypothetical protein